MTIEETVKVLTMMGTVYPDTDKNRTENELRMKAIVWQSLFADEPMGVVTAALKAFMTTSTSQFAPVPGQLKEQIRRLKNVDELTDSEAWGMVAKALRNSSYGSVEEYAKLPLEVQQCVGSPEQLREWALMDADTVASVVASNFQRGFRSRKANADALQKIPSSVNAAIGNLSNQLRLE